MTTTIDIKASLDDWKAANPLRCWRESSGLSRLDLAPAMDVTYNAIAKWESGATNPTDENMAELTRITGGKVTALKWARWRDSNPLRK